MKKIIYVLSFLIISVIGLSSCEEEAKQPIMNGDRMPISLAIAVIDKDSVNLLNDSTTRAEYMKNIRFIYRDSAFACRGKVDLYFNPNSTFLGNNNKYLSALDFNIRNCYHEVWKPYTYYAFFFGNFGPNENLQDETIIIDWGDGNKDEIRFSYTHTKSEWFLNGKKNENESNFYIIKE